MRADPAAARRPPAGDPRRAFSTSVIVSGVRCLLTYVVLPFMAPVIGFASGAGPVIGIVIGVVAIAANVVSIRRFWAAKHRWRWGYTVVSASIIVLLLVLLVVDVAALA